MPPNSSIALAPVTRRRSRGSRAPLRICGTTFARSFGTARRCANADNERRQRLRCSRRRSGPASRELARVRCRRSTSGNARRKQRGLDDRVRTRRPRRPPRDRLARRRAHPLEKAQVHPDPARRAGHGQVDELDRRLEHDAGRSGSGVSTAPRTEMPGADERRLREDAAPRSPRPGRRCRSSWAIVPKPMSASSLIRRYAATSNAAVSRRSRGPDAAQRRDIRRLLARRGCGAPSAARRVRTSCARARSRRCGVSAARWRYGSTRPIDVAPAGVDRHAKRALRPDEHGACDHELGDVDVERRLRAR